jgi:hypothetical protein
MLLALPLVLMSDTRPNAALLVWLAGWLLVPVFLLGQGWRVQSTVLPVLALFAATTAPELRRGSFRPSTEVVTHVHHTAKPT